MTLCSATNEGPKALFEGVVTDGAISASHVAVYRESTVRRGWMYTTVSSSYSTHVSTLVWFSQTHSGHARPVQQPKRYRILAGRT